MIVDEFVERPGAWLSRGRKRTNAIVLSSRVRLARNVSGVAFPGWAGKEECVSVCRRLRRIVEALPGMGETLFVDMGAAEAVDRELLKERHLISAELAEKGVGSGAVITADERVSVMINEEDHLRMQVIAPGLELQKVWKKLDALDVGIERGVDYAFSPEFGYLTACPSNIGTGLRASVLMHLSGLSMLGEMEQTVRGLEHLGLVARGLHGEGTEPRGNLYQVSNQSTLGESEASIIERFCTVVGDLARHEANARGRLRESRMAVLADCVGRSLGILTRAVLLSSGEAVDLLSGLRLGIEMGVVKNLSVPTINEIMLLTQPAHLQKVSGRALEPQERDEFRAAMVRKRLRNVTLLTRAHCR